MRIPEQCVTVHGDTVRAGFPCPVHVLVRVHSRILPGGLGHPGKSGAGPFVTSLLTMWYDGVFIRQILYYALIGSHLILTVIVCKDFPTLCKR